MKTNSETTPSPCIGVCQLENDVCMGCGRSLSEVANWHRFSEEQKQAVLDKLNQALKSDKDCA
jgi:predicted Fe-S protein YdhL (DUF1289 family)